MPVDNMQACVVLATAPHEAGRAGVVLALLQRLRGASLDVTVLDATASLRPASSAIPAAAGWEPLCRSAGVAHVVLPTDVRPWPQTPLENPAPYWVYDWLRRHPVEHVMADLTGGLIYFALAARRTGVAFRQTTFGLLVGNATGLDLEQQSAFPDDPVQLERDYLEQRCVAWADGLMGGTEAQHAWMQQRGWQAAPRVDDGTTRLARPAVDDADAAVASPTITVALVHHDRPACLRQAVQSLLAQDYTAFDVVLVDDGSRTPDGQACLTELEPAFARRGWRIVRQDNAYLGAARNRALREARGAYVLFMDDDNIARPDELSVFARAARRTGADVLTCFFDAFEGEAAPRVPADIRYRYLPAGGSLACGVFSNCFGDANALVRREAILAAGGFCEARGVGTQDYALFSKMMLDGYRLEVVPEALFQYRVSGAGMRLATSHYANQRLVLQAYRAAMPPALAPLLDFSAGAAARLLAENHDLHRSQAERDQWRAKVESMESSWSWTVTRGLRWLHGCIAGRPSGKVT
ncbi:MAG: glycosyltransferase [Lentisphaerae bacterium]|nr:glycosyltransferase [Lentisphaerota bacterium]